MTVWIVNNVSNGDTGFLILDTKDVTFVVIVNNALFSDSPRLRFTDSQSRMFSTSYLLKFLIVPVLLDN